MSFLNNLLNKKSNNTKENKLQQGVDTVQSIIEESESQKEASNKAIVAAIEEIQAHPEMPVGEFMKRLQLHTDLSDADLVKIIKQLPDIKSEEATIAAVKSTDLPSQAITEIIEEAPISPVVAQKIVNEIPDEDIQKEQQAKIEKILEEEQKQKALEEETKILEQLSLIYDDCDTLGTPKLVGEIENLSIPNKTEKINQKLTDIIAKTTAIDCMKFGDPRIPTLTRIMPAIDMFEADLPFLVQTEYKKLKKNYDRSGKEYYEFDESKEKLIREKLLENIAKQSAQTFDKIGDFNLPQTEHFQSLNDDDLKTFINTVKVYSKSVEGRDINRLSQQLKGKNKPNIQKELAFTLESIVKKIRKLPSDKQLVTAKSILAALNDREKFFQQHENNHDENNTPEK